MGNWRDDKDVEMDLDGIGGVSIMVKADVHRSGTLTLKFGNTPNMYRHQLPKLPIRESSRNRRFCQDGKTRWLQSHWLAQLCGLAR
jgi:Anp1